MISPQPTKLFLQDTIFAHVLYAVFRCAQYGRLAGCFNMALLQGLACLVAGGANGLGRATVQRLVQHGCRVVIADLPSSEGDKVASDLGENCIFIPTDVRVKLFLHIGELREGLMPQWYPLLKNNKLFLVYVPSRRVAEEQFVSFQDWTRKAGWVNHMMP